MRNLSLRFPENETVNLIAITLNFGILISLVYKVSRMKFYLKKTKAISVLSNCQPICVELVSGDRESDGIYGQTTGHSFEKVVYSRVKITIYQERADFLFLLKTQDCYCG